MLDKIPAAVVILAGFLIVSIIAGFNDNLGVFLFAFLLIMTIVWFIGGGTQQFIQRQGSKAGIFPAPSGIGTGVSPGTVT